MGVASCRSAFLCLMMSVRLVPFRISVRDLIPFSSPRSSWVFDPRSGPAQPNLVQSRSPVPASPDRIFARPRSRKYQKIKTGPPSAGPASISRIRAGSLALTLTLTAWPSRTQPPPAVPSLPPSAEPSWVFDPRSGPAQPNLVQPSPTGPARPGLRAPGAQTPLVGFRSAKWPGPAQPSPA